MGHINATDPLSGITASYLGGAGGSRIQFDFQCNTSVPFGEVHFNKLGVEAANGRMVIYAHTSEVCPDREWGQIRGGSVFLLILSVGFVAYFAIGTIVVYVISGSVSLPNEGLWGEIGESLVTGVMFIVTCGKGGSSGTTGNYDTI
jgi:hypothetical protein